MVYNGPLNGLTLGTPDPNKLVGLVYAAAAAAAAVTFNRTL